MWGSNPQLAIFDWREWMERNDAPKVTTTTEKNEDRNERVKRQEDAHELKRRTYNKDVYDGVKHSNDVLKQSNASLPAIWRKQILSRQQSRLRLGKRRHFWRPC